MGEVLVIVALVTLPLVVLWCLPRFLDWTYQRALRRARRDVAANWHRQAGGPR
jgi:hypothetical protein